MKKSNINDKIEQEKKQILSHFIKNAPFEGWNDQNLCKSAQDLGLDHNYIKLLFPAKTRDLTIYFNQNLNKQMTKTFEETNNFTKISDKIAYLIEIKLSLYSQNKEAIQKLFEYNLKPNNFIFMQQSLWQTCDQIWRLAGDNSTDFNYYSKRSLLAYVYSSTILYWLSDESRDFIDTKSFIKRKIQQVLNLGKFRVASERFIKTLFSS